MYEISAIEMILVCVMSATFCLAMITIWLYKPEEKRSNSEKTGHSDEYDTYYCGACDSTGYRVTEILKEPVPCRFCNFKDSNDTAPFKKHEARNKGNH